MKSLSLAAMLIAAAVAMTGCAGPESASGGVAAGQYESGSRATYAINPASDESRNRMLVDYARGF